ncbi:hypothetical protein CHH28_01510 [Bacterioplanes sanyensis]|uniref:DUF3106 domain-containing protein n=2 Tax=Bacterioplanes sanyensis TaxID=1249553 RepID=A0A222FG10_9GAMM|nr:hypothetical protein CHH28_01510 [Bacterioplanes sanyensis]
MTKTMMPVMTLASSTPPRPTATRRQAMLNKVFLALLLICCHGAWGQEFGQLPADVQTTLKPFEQRWDSLDDHKRAKLIRGAERWNQLSPAQKKKARQRFERFQRLPKAQRELAQQQLQQYLHLPPHKRQKLKRQYRQFQQLNPAQRQRLKQQFDRQRRPPPRP